MGMKVKSMVIACMVLLFGLVFGSFVSFEAASASPQVITTTVKYDYYVVAGYEMEPSLPPLARPSDPHFNFTGDPPVYNFGNITMVLGKDYLYEGAAGTPTGSAYAKMNITNLLGYAITITNLTVQVTDGTKSLEFYFVMAEQLFGNYTLLQVDTLDPWNPKSPFDEVNYTTGEVLYVLRDGDWVTGAVGTPYPKGQFYVEPDSLLEPDYNGDAVATNHTAPIQLANGDTFTEYFGIIIFGNATSGTQINGTITLSLTYEYEAPLGYPVPSFTYTPTDPVFDEVVTFDASASDDPNGTIMSYEWDFGDGTSGTGEIVNHTYTTKGLYTVILNVTDDEGLWLTASRFIRVGGYPVASFSYTPTDPTVGETVTFDASNSTPNGGGLTDPGSYVWDFGDGATGTGKVVTHKYTTEGNYTVGLNVTDSQGLSDTASGSITVAAAAAEFPWLWVAVGVVVVIVVVAAVAVAVRRRK